MYVCVYKYIYIYCTIQALPKTSGKREIRCPLGEVPAWPVPIYLGQFEATRVKTISGAHLVLSSPGKSVPSATCPSSLPQVRSNSSARRM